MSVGHHLSWQPHITLVSKKISKSIGIIAKAHFYLSSKTLLSLYHSLVYPFLTYCNVAWSSSYCSNLNCIYLFQKRIGRLLAKADYLANTAPLFCQLNRLLDIFRINSFSITIFMYSYHHNFLPVTFQCFFMTGEQFLQYSTRTASQYRSHFCRTNIKRFSIPYQGPKVWNFLPITTVSSSSISSQKKKLKNYLIERQFLSEVLERITLARP